MELLILDTDLKAIYVLDTFESVIWKERYCGCGDFEIYAKASEELFNYLKQDYYLCLRDSEYVMIVEDCKIKEDQENGPHMIFSGRTAESILDRRIIWNQTVLTGNLQNGIELLLNENAISPTIADRTISNLVFEASVDSAVTNLTSEAQFTRTNLYESIVKLCAAKNIGFRVILPLDSDNFIFQLYAGADRSYDQITNPYVIFSPKFENLISSDYSESNKNLKTLTVVAGEGEGADRKTTVVGSGTGLSRREMHTDARDLSQTVDEVLIPEADYLAQLAQRGTEDLTEHVLEKSFDAQLDTTRMFKYGEDFFLGDIVQIVNEYGIKAKARVTEVIRSQSTSGIEVYPTFTILD